MHNWKHSAKKPFDPDGEIEHWKTWPLKFSTTVNDQTKNHDNVARRNHNELRNRNQTNERTLIVTEPRMKLSYELFFSQNDAWQMVLVFGVVSICMPCETHTGWLQKCVQQTRAETQICNNQQKRQRHRHREVATSVTIVCLHEPENRDRHGKLSEIKTEQAMGYTPASRGPSHLGNTSTFKNIRVWQQNRNIQQFIPPACLDSFLFDFLSHISSLSCFLVSCSPLDAYALVVKQHTHEDLRSCVMYWETFRKRTVPIERASPQHHLLKEKPPTET